MIWHLLILFHSLISLLPLRPWGCIQKATASPKFSPWNNNTMINHWSLTISWSSISLQIPHQLSHWTILDKASIMGDSSSLCFPHADRTNLTWHAFIDQVHNCCLSMHIPTLLRFDLGIKQTARITGGGGLFDLHSRACKVKKVSWVRKVREIRNNRRCTWRKTLCFVGMKPRHSLWSHILPHILAVDVEVPENGD